MAEYIERKFLKKKDRDQSNNTKTVGKEESEEFEKEEFLKNNVSIIIGESGYGKTTVLKEINEVYSDDSEILDHHEIEDGSWKKNNEKRMLLLDSIDEGIFEFGKKNSFKKNLKELIGMVTSKESEIKLIATCRPSEWESLRSEFSEEITDNIKVYMIKPLSKEEIDKWLEKAGKIKGKFWSFIEKNKLESYLENIMVLKFLIENFSDFEGKGLNQNNVYQKIIEQHLNPNTDNQRTDKLEEISSEKKWRIASYIAASLTFEEKIDFKIEDYKSDFSSWTGLTIDEIKSTLATSLFISEGGKIKFFHKSAQEYLTAYFLNKRLSDREIGLSDIEAIFFNQGESLEQLEEIVHFLIGMNEELVKYFIAADPFLLRKSSGLTLENQKCLLVNTLKLLENNPEKLWTRWDCLKSDSMVQFNLPQETLYSLIEENTSENPTNSVILYLIEIINRNYSKKLEDRIFDILENRKEDIENIRELFMGTLVENIEFNKRLIKFIRENKIKIEEYYALRLFEELYSKVDLKEIWFLILEKSLVRYRFKKVLNIVSKTDVFKLIEYFLAGGTEDRLSENENILNEGLNYLVDNISSLEDEEMVVDLIIKISKSDLYYSFKFHNGPTRIKGKNALRLISEYFSDDKFYSPFIDAIKLAEIDIEKIAEKYPVEKYINKYQVMRQYIPNIFDGKIIENIDILPPLQTNSSKSEIDELKKEYEEIIENYKNNQTDEEFHKILVKRNKLYGIELNLYEKLLEDFGSNEGVLRTKVNELFQEYLQSKSEINLVNQGVSVYGLLCAGYLESLDIEELGELIHDSYSYKKALSLILRASMEMSSAFYMFSRRYKDEVLKFIKEIFENRLENGEILDFSFYMERLIKEIGAYNKENLKDLIEICREELVKNYQKYEYYNKKKIVEIVSLDKSNMHIIEDLISKDEAGFDVYFPICIEVKDINYFLENLYPDFDCNKAKFETLMSELYEVRREEPVKFISEIKNEYLKRIILFYNKEYPPHRQKYGVYTMDIFEELYQLIYMYIFKELRENEKRVPLLEELQLSASGKILEYVNYSLEQIRKKGYEKRNFSLQEILEIKGNKEGNGIFDYEKFRKDIIQIMLLLTERRKLINGKNFSEDEINDLVTMALNLKNYNTADQSRGGESESGKTSGERDIVIRNASFSNIPEVILEAVKLNSLDSENIEKHYKKLYERYDTIGNEESYFIIYFTGNDFSRFCERYKKKYLQSEFIEDTELKKENLRMGETNVPENRKILHLILFLGSDTQRI